jgi:hypothetical protein
MDAALGSARIRSEERRRAVPHRPDLDFALHRGQLETGPH